ncbi:MAG: hypothetical protein ABR597_13470, partial [Bacteroidales bacterium]
MNYLTDKDFDHVTLKHADFSIVECVNGNQLQTQIMQPIIHKLMHNMPVKIRHFRIDMLQYPFIVEQFYILSKTAYLLFLDGEFIDRIDGIISYTEFSRRINGHI